MYYRVENSIIQPHKREGYEPQDNYPKHIVFGHSTRWPQIIKNIAKNNPNLEVGRRTKGHFEDELEFTYNKVPMKYVLAPEGALGLQTQIIKHSLRGAENLVNVGCVGALNQNLREGDLVVCREAVRTSGFGTNLASAHEKARASDELSELILSTSTELATCAVDANVWCVETLYYTYQQLHAVLETEIHPDIVEMEMEAGTITTGWVNHNYASSKPKRYAQVGYISDRLPLKEGAWPDPFHGNKTQMMIPWKEKAFITAIAALSEIA